MLALTVQLLRQDGYEILFVESFTLLAIIILLSGAVIMIMIINKFKKTPYQRYR